MSLDCATPSPSCPACSPILCQILAQEHETTPNRHGPSPAVASSLNFIHEFKQVRQGCAEYPVPDWRPGAESSQACDTDLQSPPMTADLSIAMHILLLWAHLALLCHLP